MNRRAGIPALIIANGDLPPAAFVRSLAGRVRAASGIVVCADGGARHAAALGLRPTVIVGDLDSLGTRAARFPGRTAVLPVPDQQSTDLEKAIRHCIASGCAAADVVGGVGDRIDHSTGALGCLRKFGGRIKLTVHDRAGSISLLDARERLAMRPEEMFSLVPLTRCTGVRITGARFPLRGESLELGVREGISNRAERRTVVIRHSTGTLLLYRLRAGPR